MMNKAVTFVILSALFGAFQFAIVGFVPFEIKFKGVGESCTTRKMNGTERETIIAARE